MRAIRSAAAVVLSLIGATTAVAENPADKLSLDGLPGFYLDPFEYRVDPYIAAAAKLRAAGRDKAAEAMRKEPAGTFILCRMLFAPKPNRTFRRPMIGAPEFYGGTRGEDWPREPIEVVDGVPFLVSVGYNLGGQPEQDTAYLAYCLKECDWGAVEYKPRTRAEKRAALDKLLASKKWKRPLEGYEKAFFKQQIK